jgi:fucose permease
VAVTLLRAATVGAGGAVTVLVPRSSSSRTTATPGVRDAEPGCGLIALLRRHRPVRVRWLALALGISVEFATLFWASAAVQALAGASAAVGAAGVGLFAGGMVVVRLVGPAVVARFDAVAVLLVSFAVAGVASLVLRFGPGVAVRLAALAAMGAGLALVYPVASARLYGVGVADADVGAIGALASGSAVTFSPLALGALADATSLRWALLVLPALVAAALVAVVVSARGDGGAS